MFTWCLSKSNRAMGIWPFLTASMKGVTPQLSRLSRSYSHLQHTHTHNRCIVVRYKAEVLNFQHHYLHLHTHHWFIHLCIMKLNCTNLSRRIWTTSSHPCMAKGWEERTLSLCRNEYMSMSICLYVGMSTCLSISACLYAGMSTCLCLCLHVSQWLLHVMLCVSMCLNV